MSRYAIEPLNTVSRRHLFTLLGVDYFVTPQAWFSLVYPLVLGLIASLFLLAGADLTTRLLTGLAFGLAILLAYHLHTIGHILSGKLVGSPMHANLVTATVQINQYDDTLETPSWVHIGRTVGGPAANLIAAVIGLLLYQTSPSPALLFFVVANVPLMLAIMPGPTLDGEVIVRELRDWKPRR